MDGYFVVRRARQRWPTYAGIAILTALLSGVALFALAGARRTQSAYPRFLRAANASTLGYASSAGYDPKLTAQIAALPEVAQSRTFVGLNTFLAVPGRDSITTQDIEGDGTFDGRYYDQDRFRATSGRIPDRTRADEVAVNEYAAKRYHLHVGQRVELDTFATDQLGSADALNHPPVPKLRTTATIVGIGLYPDEVLQDEGDRTPRLLLTPAYTQFARKYATYSLQGLVLKHGDRDITSVRQRIDALYKSGSIEYRVTSVDTYHAEHAVKPLSIALALFGSIVALAGIVLVMQAVGRALRGEREAQATLRALGENPGRIVATAVALPGIAIVAGVALGVGLAIVASPAMPIGPVRKVEVARGFAVDTTVSLGGGAALVALLVAMTSFVAWRNAPHRVARRKPASAQGSRVAESAARAGLPTPAVEGVRMGLEGRAPTGSSGPSVVAGAVIAIAALSGAFVFGASLNTLVHEPRLYGWNADAVVLAAQGYGDISLEQAHHILDDDPRVAQWTGVTFGFGTVNKTEIPLLGVRPGGGVYPSTLSGRTIENANEVVLGPATASTLGARVGDTVTLNGEGGPHQLRVVGLATFPTVGEAHVAHTSLGVGALVATELVPGYNTDLTGQPSATPSPSALFVRFAPHTSVETEIAHLRITTRPLASFAGLDVLPVQRPAEIVNSADVGAAPVFLASVLAAGAVTSLALALAASVRRRRRDLAVLKTLGFTRRQLGSVVASQATTTIGIGLLIGIPLGAALGAVAWHLFAGQLDVVARPTFPVAVLIALAIAGVIVANAAALVPARAARRLRPASLLRTD